MSSPDIEQGSETWRKIRLGKVTASRIADVVATTKSGYGASRANYMAELVAERLTGVPAEHYTNAAMQWGIDHENDARTAYSFYANTEVEPAGFVDHPTIAMSGCSPDGYVGAEGLVEIKAPLTSTHIETLRTGKVPYKYMVQIQWQLATTGREFCDYVSFDPRMPAHLQLFVLRVPRYPARIKELETEVKKFLSELDATIADLNAKYAAAAAA
jgi:putative phage-type endonuclease